jgi:hypothetical protein
MRQKFRNGKQATISFDQASYVEIWRERESNQFDSAKAEKDALPEENIQILSRSQSDVLRARECNAVYEVVQTVQRTAMHFAGKQTQLR